MKFTSECPYVNKYNVSPGDKFNRLTAIEYVKWEKGFRYWLFECDCGKLRILRMVSVANGHTKSCGCLKLEVARALNLSHGMAVNNKSRHPLYVAWSDMIQRCTNPKNDAYPRYGGRGIEVCSAWRNSFKEYYDWAIAHGWMKGLVIDRKDNEGNYCPENCRICTISRNNRNKRNNVLVEIFGKTMTLVDAVEEHGRVDYAIARTRIRTLGWDPMEAITTPLMELGQKRKKKRD